MECSFIIPQSGQIVEQHFFWVSGRKDADL